MSRRVHLSEDRIPGRPIIAAGVVVVMVSVLLVAWAWLIYHRESRLRSTPMTAPAAVSGVTISDVRQTLILEERPGRRLVLQQRERLDSFGWIDREAGMVHIPIEAAMEQLAEGAR